jgi:uncharacterized Tic20 family protein
MIIPSASTASSDERILAALAHASVLLPGWGFLGPLIIWIIQRKKSAFVTFHALQALVYQLFQMIYWMVLSIILGVLMMTFGILSASAIDRPGPSPSPFLFFLPQMIMFGGMILGFAFYDIFGVLGGILTLARKDYRYPILGRWMEKYLSQPSKSGGTESGSHQAATQAPDFDLQTREAA